ncbi:MAG: tetratricopeptide repeat protein [Chitinophagaceae bacterium]|nr:tetratricopeptide repeat protein [Chitinophagaceae bacterium]
MTPTDSLAQLDTRLKGDFTSFEAWHDKGMLLAEMKDTAGAIEALEMSFSLQPLETIGMSLANLYAEVGNERAISLCDAMLKKDTAHVLTDAVFTKGIYYSKVHNGNMAIAAFEECIRRDWKFVEAYMEKGIILYDKKDFTAALKTFTLASTVNSTYPDACFWMGRCYENLERIKEAEDSYKKALALDNSFTEAAQAIKRINMP